MLPLQLDLRELLKRGNGPFGSAELTGIHRRRHANIPRLLYKGDEAGLNAMDHHQTWPPSPSRSA